MDTARGLLPHIREVINQDRDDREISADPWGMGGGSRNNLCEKELSSTWTMRGAATHKQPLLSFLGIHFTDGSCPILPQNVTVFYGISY